MDDRVATPRRWHKSTRSSDSECVEVAAGGGHVFVRDSKTPGPVLEFSAPDWVAFVRAATTGTWKR
jgi:hypothetical protein